MRALLAEALIAAVSILARPEGRALPGRLVDGADERRVSILARPEGRALLDDILSSASPVARFQSSPGPKAGRSAIGGGVAPVGRDRVSILARPEGRALRHWRWCSAGWSRPSFNPRPARRPGAPCAGGSSNAPRTTRFNPRPARRPGAPSRSTASSSAVSQVSILARPEGRALRAGRPPPRARCPRFQSSPGPKAGRSPQPSKVCCSSPSSFQSSPGPKAGRSPAQRSGTSSRTTRFNPRPARRPGAPRRPPACFERLVVVSILARPEGRALRDLAVGAVGQLYQFQSSPGPKAGRSRGIVAVLPSVAHGFQSSPGPKAGRSSTFPTKMGRAPSILAGSRRFAGPYAPAEPGALLTAPSHSLDRARVPRLSVCADGSRTPRSQKTSGPRWSNFGGTPNTCR